MKTFLGDYVVQLPSRPWRFVQSLFVSSLLCMTWLVGTGLRVPELTPRDVTAKAREIMREHVLYKSMSPEIARRLLGRFLEELDPSKTYLLAGEVEEFLDPDHTLLAQVVDGFHAARFGPFEDMYERMLFAIERRQKMEHSIHLEELPKGVVASEFKDLGWATSEEELRTRILRVRGMQMESARRWVTDEPPEQAMARLEKWRRQREKQFLPLEEQEGHAMLLSTILKSIASSLDAHTVYLTPDEAEQFLMSIEQKISGIGAILRDDLDGLTITELSAGGPAERSGLLKSKDKIIAVDGESIIGLDLLDAVNMIRGPSNTGVSLTVLRPKTEEVGAPGWEKLQIQLQRGEVAIQEERLKTHMIPFGTTRLAHLELKSFYDDKKESSGHDIANALRSLALDSEIGGVLLDLRHNPGGLITEAVRVAGAFLEKGVICSTKYSDGSIQHHRNLDTECVWKGPLVVLIDRTSASAAEIVAQSLQDWGRAVIVGDEYSWGKGSFQVFTADSGRQHKVDPKGEYKVTYGLYYTVSGKSPQLKGVHSDVVVPGPLCKEEIGELHHHYPLEPDEITPHFMDVLDDLSFVQKIAIGRAYREQMQQRSLELEAVIPQLQENSKQRMSASTSYKKYLEKIETKSSPGDIDYAYEDHQLEEALNVLRDLVLISSSPRRGVLAAS